MLRDLISDSHGKSLDEIKHREVKKKPNQNNKDTERGKELTKKQNNSEGLLLFPNVKHRKEQTAVTRIKANPTSP